MRFIKRQLCFLTAGVLVFVSSLLHAQVVLKPSIGLYSAPDDADLVCEIPIRADADYEILGFQIADTVPDFTLYDLNGDSVNLKESLETGKPVLLITSSYTCPKFRDDLPAINDLQLEFGDEILIYLIYVVEAHPDIDVSPYSGFVNTTDDNFEDGILYQQPKTYGERKQVVSDMLNNLEVTPQVLIDGPCNNFWIDYECGPVTAYLLRSDGVVFSKHGWFNQEPHDMTNDINELLGNETGGENATYEGHFSFIITEDSVAYVEPGTTAYIHGSIKNTDKAQGVLIEIVKQQQVLPESWATSICTDVCYSPSLDSVTLYLEPDMSSPFTMDFYTGEEADTGTIVITFRNHEFPDEIFVQTFKTFSGDFEAGSAVVLYPNPAKDIINISVGEALLNSSFQLYDVTGKIVEESKISSLIFSINVSGLSPGIYFVRIGNEVEKIIKK